MNRSKNRGIVVIAFLGFGLNLLVSCAFMSQSSGVPTLRSAKQSIPKEYRDEWQFVAVGRLQQVRYEDENGRSIDPKLGGGEWKMIIHSPMILRSPGPGAGREPSVDGSTQVIIHSYVAPRVTREGQVVAYALVSGRDSTLWGNCAVYP